MTLTSFAVAVLNTALGTVYTCYGLMTIVDMKRGWRMNGFSHFGAAWIAMAFTCGPHHLDHGLHGFISGRNGGWLDLVTILVGFTPGVVWFLLRVEAMFGGRGDRFLSGTPLWLEMIPTALAMYTAAGPTPPTMLYAYPCSRCAWSAARSSVRPTPRPRSASMTASGPKKFRAVAS